LRGLAELIIALLELLEAEARALRAGSFRLGLSLALLGTAGTLMLVGVGLILRALYLYLGFIIGTSSTASKALASGLVALLKRSLR
jgi:hypothetical protein